MNEVHVLMIGGKRCGKTTVLASMYEETGKVLAATSLRLSLTDPTTGEYLVHAMQVIRHKMAAFDTPLTRVDVDENPTSAEKICEFSLEGSGIQVPIHIHDIPGEWLEDSHSSEVKNLVKVSQIIIIAIDTPYLFSKMTVEGYGQYHLDYNRPDVVTNFFKNEVSADDLQERLILFVPIKCERYYHLTNTPKLNIYHRDYMQEIKEAVRSGYRELIDYLCSAEGLRNNCTIAVTPILSAGGIDFVRFREDEQTGKMISLYQKPEFITEAQSGYCPQFCEQPMIYMLVHILTRQMTAEEPKKGRLGLFGSGKSSGPDLRTSIRTLQLKMKHNTGSECDDGYFIFQNENQLLGTV